LVAELSLKTLIMTLNELFKQTRILVEYQGEDFEIIGCDNDENDLILERTTDQGKKPKQQKIKLKDVKLI